MIISVQRGLCDIKKRLEAQGHKVVYDDEYAHPANAYIYKGGKSMPQTHMSHGTLFTKIAAYGEIMGNVSRGSFYSDSACNAAIRIDAAGKTFDEVERLLFEQRHIGFF